MDVMLKDLPVPGDMIAGAQAAEKSFRIIEFMWCQRPDIEELMVAFRDDMTKRCVYHDMSM